ncbi:PHP domain-containing protein [Cloacibacillus evryensis]|uniref:PHP domain-containing protein n=1 Tax=Cloacibacillus evryensis TaxID=508460 RepID=UPI0022E99390|nr:PHP domain-containing protein [Cloacibacillus evryensis]MEA5035126.1 PHP domain-containing protein [Cloacibacillus evryensis]
MILIDMHVHSCYSDGTFTPEQLVSAARRRGLSLLSLTDHDTTAGLGPLMRACAKEGIKGLCGIELSAEAPFTLHILGYRISPGAGRLEGRLDYIRGRRDARNLVMCEKLRALGLGVTIEEVREISGGEVVARPHIARLLINKGYVGSVAEAFAKYLARGAAAYVSRERLSAEECISLIREAGGVAVLAHPFQCRLDDDGLAALLCRLRDAGLWGMEAIYGANSPETTYRHLKMAGRFGLYTTAGSDFHGGNSPGIELGMPVSDDILPWARLGIR